MIGNKSILLTSFLALLHVSQALPQATKVQPRADNAPQVTPGPLNPWSGDYFGPVGVPKISHLEDASVLADQEDNLKGVSAYPVVLLGFLKCNPDWVASWFPKQQETLNPEYADMPKGEGYVLSYMWDREKPERLAQSVKLAALDPVSGHLNKNGTIMGGIVKNFYPPTQSLEGAAWWPWALLKGALSARYDSSADHLDLDKIILALSAIEVVEEKERDPVKLWDITLAKINETPIWMETKDDFWVAMSPVEDDKGRRVDFSRFQDGKKFDQEWTIDEIIEADPRITHLKDLVTFKGTRIGEWKPVALEAAGTSKAEKPAPTK